jgi:hypothetical protein
MALGKLVFPCALAALTISGCGIAAKPLAGTPDLSARSGMHGRIDRLRRVHYLCLRGAGLPAQTFTSSGGRPAIQVGPSSAGPTIVFEPTPGAAQELQIDGQVQGAEVIGSALLYPNLASDATLSTVERCVALDVTG